MGYLYFAMKLFTYHNLRAARTATDMDETLHTETGREIKKSF